MDTKDERAGLKRLYLTSREILMMDRGTEIGAQLARLIGTAFKAEAIAVWDVREVKMDKAGPALIADDEVRAIYFSELSESDESSCCFKWVLRLGTRAVGTLYLAGTASDSLLDSRSADAIASLAAIALERTHCFLAETDAEAARRSGELRSTVIDGLAHAFKSPLTTIRTASAGLLETPNLGPGEKELASLIESEANRLAKLTNNVLEAAELDEADFGSNCEEVAIDEFLEECQMTFASIVDRGRMSISQRIANGHVWTDRRLLQMALLQFVDNAAKYSRPASVITLAVESTNSEVVFSVQNEGSYVSPRIDCAFSIVSTVPPMLTTRRKELALVQP